MLVPSIKPSTLILAIVTAVVVLAAFVGWLWQPDQQIRKHQKHLIAAAEKGKMMRVREFLSDDYADPWNKSAEQAIARLEIIVRNFFALTIREGRVGLETEGNRGHVISRLRLDGKGTVFAEVVVRETNSLGDPFTFFWRREGWKPWDWRLVRVENPSLRVELNNRFW
jgi:hypothetical protein